VSRIPVGLMRKAKRVADKDCDLSFHVVAIALSDTGHFICAATNRWQPAPKLSEHAEIMLLRKLFKIKAKERFGKIHVMVIRFKKDGSTGMSKPCINCASELIRYGINQVTWTTGTPIINHISYDPITDLIL